MKRLSAVALPLILVALAGCGSSSSSSSSSTASPTPAATTTASAAASGAVVPVVMQNISFNPPSIHAKVGQTVKWTNMDSAPHNVTYVSGPQFTSSPTFTNGGTFTLKLTKAGTIAYRCTIHPGMNGTILVAP
jgi:plastocyanin